MSHSVVRGAIFIPPPTPGGGLSYYILLTRQFGIYLEYDSLVYIANTTGVLPLTPLTYLWRKTKDYIFVVSLHLLFVSLNYYNYERK